MDFAFTPEQERLRAHVVALLDDVCRAEYEALGKHGWLGLIVPTEYGGSGGSPVDLAILLEETGRHFEELAMWVFRTITYGGYAVMHHGTEAQREALLPRVARGELSVCFGLSEPGRSEEHTSELQ